MARVAYLFGAGASANALPIVSQIGARIEEQLAWLADQHSELPQKPLGESLGDYSHERAFNDYQAALKELHKAMLANLKLTIDTYARAVQRSDSFKARQLKAVMTLFFAIEQHKGRTVDWRYEDFFNALIGTRERRLPNNVVILTWNYDQQIAMALGQLTKDDSVFSTMRTHKIRTLRSLAERSQSEYQVLHLNGIAGYHWEREEIPSYDGPHQKRSLSEIWHHWLRSFALTYYLRGYHDMYPLLDYAWDLDDDLDAYLDNAMTPLAEVERLVVVGYSFPAYNRKVDMGLLRRMPKLRKLTVQVRKKHRGEELRERLEEEVSHLHGKIRVFEGCDHFVLPEEIYQQ